MIKRKEQNSVYNLNLIVKSCIKLKVLVKKTCPGLDYEVETRHKKIALRIFNWFEAKKNLFYFKIFGLVPDSDKIVQENMKIFLKNKILAAIYFNECNLMAFHNLSRNHEATSVYSLTSLLGLGPKCFPQNDRITFKNSEDMTDRLRKDARTIWLVLNNIHSGATDETPKLFRKRIN